MSKKTPTTATKSKDRSMASDSTPGERKVALVRKMRQVNATSALNAKSARELAEKMGYTHFDVYSLLSGGSGKAGSNPRCLLATGHVKTADSGEGLGYYLTAKGVKSDFSEPPFTKGTKAAKPAKEKAKAAPKSTPDKVKAKPKAPKAEKVVAETEAPATVA